jgi:hypothetical protein
LFPHWVLFVSRDFAGANPRGAYPQGRKDLSHAEDQTEGDSDFGHNRRNCPAFNLIPPRASGSRLGGTSLKGENLDSFDKLCQVATELARGLRFGFVEAGRAYESDGYYGGNSPHLLAVLLALRFP